MPSEPITFEEPVRVGLCELYAKLKGAEREYLLARSFALCSLRLNPQDPHEINLDTGVITPAAPKE